jgi:hypothetical protein
LVGIYVEISTKYQVLGKEKIRKYLVFSVPTFTGFVKMGFLTNPGINARAFSSDKKVAIAFNMNQLN